MWFELLLHSKMDLWSFLRVGGGHAWLVASGHWSELGHLTSVIVPYQRIISQLPALILLG